MKNRTFFNVLSRKLADAKSELKTGSFCITQINLCRDFT